MYFFLNLVNILLENSSFQKLWGSWTECVNLTHFQIKTTVLKTYTFRGSTGENLGPLYLGRSLRTDACVPGNQTHRKLAWALLVLAGTESCWFCFVLFFSLPWPHLFLIFPLAPWFYLPGLQKQQGLWNLHTDDRRQDSQELVGSAPWGTKGGVFRVATRPHQGLRLRNCGQHWEGASLV